jgi:hypothetical protein
MPAMFSGTVLAALALARTAGRTQFEASVMGRAKLRKGAAPVALAAFSAAMVLCALVRTAHAVLGQGIGWGRSPRS